MNCVSTSEVSKQQKKLQNLQKATKQLEQNINNCQKSAKKATKNVKHGHVMANKLHPWAGAPAVQRVCVLFF